MSTLTLAARDTATMLRRNLKHTLRYPTMVTMIIGMPIVLLLLFVYVFGATLGNGLAGTVHGGRAAYLTYVTVEVASNAPMFLMVLPFLGSGFVPTSSMPGAIRWFTEYQPFTPAIQTLRGLLLSAPIGANAIIAIAWSTGITLASYLWARKLFSRDPSRS